MSKKKQLKSEVDRRMAALEEQGLPKHCHTMVRHLVTELVSGHVVTNAVEPSRVPDEYDIDPFDPPTASRERNMTYIRRKS